MACQCNHIEVAEILLRHSADIHVQVKNKTPTVSVSLLMIPMCGRLVKENNAWELLFSRLSFFLFLSFLSFLCLPFFYSFVLSNSLSLIPFSFFLFSWSFFPWEILRTRTQKQSAICSGGCFVNILRIPFRKQLAYTCNLSFRNSRWWMVLLPCS